MLNNNESSKKGFLDGVFLLIRFTRLLQISKSKIFASVALAAFAGILAFAEMNMLMMLIQGIIHKEINGHGILGNMFNFLQIADVSFSVKLLILITATFCISILISIFDYISDINFEKQVLEVDVRLRSLSFSRLLTFGKMYFDIRDYSDIHPIIFQYTNTINNQLRLFRVLFSNIFLLVIHVLILGMLSMHVAMLAPFIFIIRNIFLSFFAKKIHALSQKNERKKRNSQRGIVGIFSCIPLIKSYAMEEAEKDKFMIKTKDEMHATYKVHKSQKQIEIIESIGFIICNLILVGYMGYIFNIDSTFGASSFIISYLVIRRMNPNFAAISNFVLSFSKSWNEIIAMYEMLVKNNDKYMIPKGSLELKEFSKHIKIKNLSFSYDKKVTVLDNISFTIEKGKKTAIIGTTGSGKTTIINLLLRFYDCPKGTIFIDDIDIKDINPKSYLEHVAIVSQDVLLFNDTMRNNILYGIDEINEGKVVDVTKKTQLYEVINRLPRKSETILGYRGNKLSGGEKQRTSIARALLRSSDILILDEASSALDARTEKLIHQTIDEASESKTLVVIAHRLSTIKNVDHIIVLENGKVVEQGSFSDLVENKKWFYDHWKEQSIEIRS